MTSNQSQMTDYIPVFESTLAKLTDEEKDNLQASLDSYFREGFISGYDEASEEILMNAWDKHDY